MQEWVQFDHLAWRSAGLDPETLPCAAFAN